MDISANQGKNLIADIDGQRWLRIPVKTHFVTINDTFEGIIEKYVLPVSKNGDIVALGQKIVSILQKRIVYKKDIKVGFWAKILSRFAKKTPYGFSVGNPLKMQLAINLAGLPKIFFAGVCSVIAKIFGRSGTFYRIAGNQINEIDGFYGKAYPVYADMGILGPVDCDKLCEGLKKIFNLSFFVADVNDLGGNILGASQDLKGREVALLKILKDNPAGQSDEQTPLILIRKNDNT